MSAADVEGRLCQRLDPSALAAWCDLPQEARDQLLQWAAKPRTSRGRAGREDELLHHVALGLPSPPSTAPSVVESFLDGLIFGGR